MPLSHYALDTFVSQDMSKLTACAPRSLATEFPERNHWLSQFVLRRIFHNHVSEERAALAFILVRRAEAALDEWELACEAAHDVRKPSGYFKMLRHLENCVTALWQGLEFGRRALETKLFDTFLLYQLKAPSSYARKLLMEFVANDAQPADLADVGLVASLLAHRG